MAHRLAAGWPRHHWTWFLKNADRPRAAEVPPRPVRKLVLSLAGATALAVAIAASPLVPDNYLRYKATNLVDFQDGTGAGRLKIWATALEETQQRRWIGWGTYSFGDLHKEGTETNQTLPWIGNFVVTLLHDSGVIGTFLFGAFLTVTLRGGLRDAKCLWAHTPDQAVRLVGLCYGAVALLIAFLATTGFSFGYIWIALGLIGAHRRRAPHVLGAVRVAARLSHA